ncbi:MAG: LysR family transcriptional regulator, partial [Nitrospiraceae bacterium]|nr:LysR family transcriptional regulator [Nitrospiraceae bacterium]
RESDSGTRISTEKALKTYKIDISKINIVAYLGSNTSIKEAVKKGVGFGIVSRFSVKDELRCGLVKAVKVRPLKLKRKFYAVKRKDLTLSPAARTIWNNLSRIFAI